MTPYARCSTRLSRRRDAENRAWITAGIEEGGAVVHLRADPRAVGAQAHARMEGVQAGAVARVRTLIEAAVAAQAKRWGFTDLAERVAAALARSSRTGVVPLRRARGRG